MFCRYPWEKDQLPNRLSVAARDARIEKKKKGVEETKVEKL